MAAAEEVTESSELSLFSDCPPNVTRAFCVEQERLAALNRARRLSADRGIEKFVLAWLMRRGRLPPSVTFESVDPSVDVRLAVVQPVAPAMVQVLPVNPLIHIQPH